MTKLDSYVDRVDKFEMWLDEADLRDLDRARGRLVLACQAAIARWGRKDERTARLHSVRRAMVAARIAKHCRLSGAVHQALSHEADRERHVSNAMAIGRV